MEGGGFQWAASCNLQLAKHEDIIQVRRPPGGGLLSQDLSDITEMISYYLICSATYEKKERKSPHICLFHVYHFIVTRVYYKRVYYTRVVLYHRSFCNISCTNKSSTFRVRVVDGQPFTEYTSRSRRLLNRSCLVLFVQVGLLSTNL